MVKIKKFKTGNKVQVTSDLFDDIRECLKGYSSAQRALSGTASFNKNSSLASFSTKDEGISYYAQLATANVIMALKLYKEGVAEVNEYMNKLAKDPKSNYVAKTPGIEYIAFDGYIDLDEMLNHDN